MVAKHDEEGIECRCNFCDLARMRFGHHRFRHKLLDRWSKRPVEQFSPSEAFGLMRTWSMGNVASGQIDGALLVKWEGEGIAVADA